MITAYFDTSALVKGGLDEPGAELVRSLWDAASVRCTSRLGPVEVAAALAAGRRSGRLSVAGHRRATEVWRQMADQMVMVELAPSVAEGAARLAVHHHLTSADAVHLASAVALGGDTVFACWDERLRTAAAREGLALSPPRMGQT